MLNICAKMSDENRKMYNKMIGGWMSMHDVSVDAGRSEVKIAWFDKFGAIRTAKFLSMLSDDTGTKMHRDLGSEEYRLTINGHKYFIGEIANDCGANSRGITHDEKTHDETITMILAGVAATKLSGNLRLGVCVPLDNHAKESPLLRAKLEREHVIEENSIKRRVNIVEVKVSAEGLVSAFHTPKTLVDGKLVGFVNVGSFKSNIGCLNHKGKYVDNRSGSLERVGMNRVLEDGDSIESLATLIKTEMNRKLRWSEPYKDPRTKRTIPAILVICGGAARDIAPYLSNEFSHHPYPIEIVPHEDALFSDCIGTLKWLQKTR